MRFSLHQQLGVGALATCLALATSLASGMAHAEESKDGVTAWRLFVADHSEPVVRAIDFETGKELGRYDLKGYAALTASASGKTVFATQSDTDMVHVIKSGIVFSDHGEHRDLDVEDAALLPVTFEGKRPFHVVPHDDHAILFYDDLETLVVQPQYVDGRQRWCKAISYACMSARHWARMGSFARN